MRKKVDGQHETNIKTMVAIPTYFHHSGVSSLSSRAAVLGEGDQSHTLSSRETKKDCETNTYGEIVRVHETQDDSAGKEGWAAKVNRRDASSLANRGEGKE